VLLFNFIFYPDLYINICTYIYVQELFISMFDYLIIYNLTCAALPDGSLKRCNYASRARPSAPDGPHAPKRKESARTMRPKILRAEGDKKRRRETQEDFSRKEKYMRFAASRR
jgi:hypothetical protein